MNKYTESEKIEILDAAFKSGLMLSLIFYSLLCVEIFIGILFKANANFFINVMYEITLALSVVTLLFSVCFGLSCCVYYVYVFAKNGKKPVSNKPIYTAVILSAIIFAVYFFMSVYSNISKQAGH